MTSEEAIPAGNARRTVKAFAVSGLGIAMAFLAAYCFYHSDEDDGDYWACFVDGRRSGYGHGESREKDGNVTSDFTYVNRYTSGGVAGESRWSVSTTETADGKALGFRTVLKTGGGEVITEGRVLGGDRLLLTKRRKNRVVSEEIPWPRQTKLGQGESLLLMKALRTGGGSFQTTSLNTTTFELETQTWDIGPRISVDLLDRRAELTSIFRARRSPNGHFGIATLYVDAKGQVLRMEEELNGQRYESVRCSKRLALRRFDPPDLPYPRQFECSSKKAAAQNSVRVARAMIFAFEYPGREPPIVPTTDEQTVSVSGRILRITIRPRSPATQPTAAPAPPPQFRKHTLFVDSDSLAIVAAAKRVIAGAEGAAQKASLIEQFVYSHATKKVYGIGDQIASEVLNNRTGDCKDHSLLMAALCRAAGLPCQFVDGYAYSYDSYRQSGMLIPHRWISVHVGGMWISYDPTWGGFDAGHVALNWHHDPERMCEMSHALDSLKLVDVDLE